MFVQSSQQATSEEFENLGTNLANLLRRNGDHVGANAVLSAVSAQANTPYIALQKAEYHLSRKDLCSALAALIPVWEAGYDDEEVESMMGLLSLAMGLDDVVDTLTSAADASPSLMRLRWILSCCDGEIESAIDLQQSSVQWSIVRAAMILAEQGRTDIVGAIVARLEQLNESTLLDRLSGVPRRTWEQARPIQPPIDMREDIISDLSTPSKNAVYNWVWAAARQIFRGESVLLIGRDTKPFLPLLGHVHIEMLNLSPSDEIEEALMAYGSGAFDHVIILYGFEHATSARDLTRLLWRHLRHGGQLHSLSTTPTHIQSFEAYTHPARKISMIENIGFEVQGYQFRDADGVPTEQEEAHVFVLRAQKNLV